MGFVFLAGMTVGLVPVSRNEVNLDICLSCGQVFDWVETMPGEWTNVLGKTLLTLWQTDEGICFRTHSNEKVVINSSDVEKQIRNFFQLDVNLTNLYEKWSKCQNFAQKQVPGIRIMDQDPIKCLFSFICSANNNVKRISKMVKFLSTEFGRRVGKVDEIDFFSFPEPHELCVDGVEKVLRDAGFGYRAKYIVKTAHILTKDGTDTLYRLRSESYSACVEYLCSLSGVGAKVADCISLMSLRKSHVVPVDTHVWQIARRDYKFGGKDKLTKAIYKQIGVFFHEHFGDYAGWAHSVLFYASLNKK